MTSLVLFYLKEKPQEFQYYIGFWLEIDYHVKEEFYYLDLCPDITIIESKVFLNFRMQSPKYMPPWRKSDLSTSP